jgi:cell division septation protein DedD
VAPGTGTVTGFFFNDVNGNGLQDANEPSLPNRDVTLTPVNTKASTGANGQFVFGNVPTGTSYKVYFGIIDAGCSFTGDALSTGSSDPFSLVPGEIKNVNAGIYCTFSPVTTPVAPSAPVAPAPKPTKPTKAPVKPTKPTKAPVPFSKSKSPKSGKS